ncbi:MAG TPA: hypothetical protein PK402_01930 [Tepidisphaeraceae bacterium]|nr:hypothetical protein [Tepidisphaeraceae bacterium]
MSVVANTPQSTLRRTTRQRRPRMVTDRAWFLVPALVVVVICLDVFHWSAQGGVKQLPTLILSVTALFAFVANRFRISRLSFPAMCFAVLMVIAIPGLVINKLSGASSSLFSAIALMVLPLSVYVLPTSWLQVDGRRMLKWLGVIATVFAIGALVQLFLDRRGMTAVRIHERAFLIPLVLLVPHFLKMRWATFTGCVAILAILYLDPRTTLLFVIAITVASLIFFRLAARERQNALVAMAIIAAIVVAGGTSLLQMVDASYKGAFGRSSNSDFRESLIEVGMQEFRKSPVFGDFFRGPTSFESGGFEYDSNGKLHPIFAPLHNDYLEFLTKGGIIGASLLVAGLAGTVYLAWRNMMYFRQRGHRDLANWQAVLVTSVTALMFTIMVNPVLNNPVCATPAYFLIAQVWMCDRFIRSGSSNAKRVQISTVKTGDRS